jgi:hypothetical protein
MSQPVGNCPGCGGGDPFEQIHAGTCPDTGGECPEWACASCGAAVIMGTVPGASAMDLTAGQSVAGQTVRAA